MKRFHLLLLFPFLGFAQNIAERQKIVSSYDQNDVKQIKTKALKFDEEQKQLIAEYKRTHVVKESEYHSLQRIYDGIPVYFSISNQGSSQTLRTNSMYPGGSLGLDVTGAGIVVGVWDGGKVRNTHQEFNNNKITLNDDSTSLSSHATHVTGTIVATGVSPVRRGIAFGATATTSDWNSDYLEMVNYGASGYLVSNHSYGYSTDEMPLWRYGQYDYSSIEIDEISNTFPYYQIVIAAGNDRNQGSNQDFSEGGYDLLSGTGTSKNGITVAAVEQISNYVDNYSVVMSSFSNYGPPDDGRIKPDISAKGVNVSSPVSSTDSAYDSYNGTSMAAPAITGMIALLQKHYNNLYSTYMRASTVKGLICHTAREAGFYLGPDYEFGWGLGDARTAANLISNKGATTILSENILNSGDVFEQEVQINSTQRLIATICWTDPVGSPNNSGSNDPRTPKIKNNLDIKIFKDGMTYYPWRLTYDDPFQPAARDADNDVDNVERVEIDTAEPGVYTIQVSHKNNLVNGQQPFSLVASGQTSLTLAAGSYDFENKVVLYPNPVKNILNITAPATSAISQVTVFDILGKQMSNNGALLNNALEVSGLAKGIYFAKIVIDGKAITKKFIKD